MSEEAAPSAPRLTSLDALRGVLALIVCVGHAGGAFITPISPESGPPSALLVFGGILFLLLRASVLCFFALSGFLIAASVRQNRQRHGHFSAGDFALARAVRLLPPLLFAIVLTRLLAALLGSWHLSTLPAGIRLERTEFVTQPLAQLWAIVTLGARGDLPGDLNRPLWTLKLEIELYVFAGLAAAALFPAQPGRLFGLLRRLAAGLLFGGYAALLLEREASTHALLADLLAQFVCFSGFGLGCLAFLAQDRIRAARPGRLIAIALALTATLLAVFAATGDRSGELEARPLLIAAQLAFFLAACGLIALLVPRQAPPVLQRLGGFSYTLYVVHFPLLLFFAFCLLPVLPRYSAPVALGLTAAAVVVVSALSSLTARLIERPGPQRRWLLRMFNLLRAELAD
jgi:peptidoglycan/LPS O-acetylase OafA/YrhL